MTPDQARANEIQTHSKLRLVLTVLGVLGITTLMFAGLLFFTESTNEDQWYPKTVGSDIIPTGMYSWDERALGFVGDGLLFAHYKPYRKVIDEGFVLMDGEIPKKHRIEFGPSMKSVTITTRFVKKTISAPQLRIGEILRDNKDHVTISVVSLELQPLLSKQVGITESYRIEKVVFEIKPTDQ